MRQEFIQFNDLVVVHCLAVTARNYTFSPFRAGAMNTAAVNIHIQIFM